MRGIGFMGEYFKNINWKHVLIMCIGNILAGMGIAIFKLSGLGNDPFSGMNMAVSAKIGIAYGNFQVMLNVVLLIIEIVFGRKFIGLGTVVNAVFLGYIVTFFYNIFVGASLEPDRMAERLVILCIGVVICCLGLSMYQMTNAGIAPYDSISLITSERWPKVPYFWHRMSNDAICALVCYLSGGIIGIGTLVTAFGLGPVIHFFNRVFTGKLLAWVDGE